MNTPSRPDHPCALAHAEGWEGISAYEVLLLTGEAADLADLLEIRLQELGPVVHRFVLVEYDIDFEGEPRRSAWTALTEGPEAYRSARAAKAMAQDDLEVRIGGQCVFA